jgi:hypothetical protein
MRQIFLGFSGCAALVLGAGDGGLSPAAWAATGTQQSRATTARRMCMENLDKLEAVALSCGRNDRQAEMCRNLSALSA